MQLILTKRVVPVIVIDKVEDALPLAEALLKGGLPVMEITFRTPAAEGAVREVAKRFPEILLGAGTILTRDQLERAQAAGATFAVAPGLNARVITRANELGMPFVPGVMTPSEVELALELGCKILKFFPAESAGGVKMLQALAGPYAHTGVKFIPLGGISPVNAPAYLSLPIVGAIGGSWIAEKALIAAHQWSEITARAATALTLSHLPLHGK